MSYADIPGFMAPEVESFYRLVAERVTSESRIVEVGVAYGRSLAFLVEAFLARGLTVHTPQGDEMARPPTIYAVDVWADFMGCERDDWIGERARLHRDTAPSPYDACFAELARHSPTTAQIVIPIRRKSTEAAIQLTAHSPFDVVFIDADHTYESTRADILHWAPLVKRGGLLAGDDYAPEFPGVVRAVDELARSASRHFTTKGRVWIREVT